MSLKSIHMSICGALVVNCHDISGFILGKIYSVFACAIIKGCCCLPRYSSSLNTVKYFIVISGACFHSHSA